MKLSRAVRLLGGAAFPHADQAGTVGIPFLKVSDLDVTAAETTVSRAANYVDAVTLRRLRAHVAPIGSTVMPKIGAAVALPRRRVRLGAPCAFDNNVLAMVPISVDSRYLTYWIRQLDLGAVTNPGAVASIDMVALRAMRMPDLDRAAQRRIADFLDRESARIAGLVGAVGALAAGDVEARERMLRDLVGVDRNPWIEIRWLACTGTGHTPSRMNEAYWVPDECVHPWFTLADVWQIRDGQRTVVRDTETKISPAGLTGSSAVLHPAGTVLFSRTASVGYSALMGVPMAVSQDFMTWTCGPRLDPRFLLFALRATKPEIDALKAGSTHQTIYMPDLHALKVPVPSLDEQRSIVAEIEQCLERSHALNGRLEDLRKRLDEYRDALITEAVTGQLDVSRLSESQMEESLHAASEGERPEVLAS